MAVVKCKPTSPGRRHVVKVVNPELHKGKPFAPLVEKNSKSGGRNNNGRITTRHIGGGHKQAYRIVDFKRNKDGIPAIVERLEYDPNRSANIALVLYKDGERRYILAPKGLKAGDQIQSGVDAAIKAGNTLPMRNIPVGSTVHNVEMKPGKGGQLARSAGTYVQIVARDGAYVTITSNDLNVSTSGTCQLVLTFRSLLVMVLMSPCVCVLVKCVKSKQTAALLWAKLAMLSICCAFWVKLVLHAGVVFVLPFAVLR